MSSIPEILELSAKRYPDRIAIQGPEGTRLTYSQAWQRVESLARKLQSKGWDARRPILFVSETGPHWILHFFAILRAGHSIVSLPDNLPLELIGLCAKLSNAQGLVVSDIVAKKIQGFGMLRQLSMSDWAALPEDAKGLPAIEADQIALLALTSGSTENPRMVQLTHSNILSNVAAFKQMRQPTPDDSLLSVLPPTHLFELVVGQLVPLSSGARVVFLGSMLPNRMIDAIRNEKITYSIVVPGILRILFQYYISELVAQGISEPKWLKASEQDLLKQMYDNLDSEKHYRRADVIKKLLGNSLKAFVIGGAAINPAWAKILLALGVDLEVGYGLTEASPVVSLGSAREIPAGSVGRVLPGIDLRISSDGEIQIRGPSVMKGYLHNAEANSRTLVDGWLCTGDRGRWVDGFLYIEGRIKEAMVNEGGETIYPDEIEAYYGDPVFQEICVAPLSGEFGNDIPLLVVVTPSALPPSEELVAKYRELKNRAPVRAKVFGLLCLQSPLPRTALGKPKRRQLILELTKGMTEPWKQIRQSPNFVA